MKNHGMTMTLVASLAFISASMGCAVSSSAPETDAASETPGETILLNEEGQAALQGGGEMRLERQAGESTFSLREGAGWQAVAPGVWELPAEDGSTQRLAVGEEGHRWLIEQAQAELDALYAQRDAEGENPELAQKIAAAEEMLATAQQRQESAVGSPTPQALSCSIKRYLGPSGPVTNPPIAGAAALAQIVCTGGCATFTVTSQACCSATCSSVASFTKTVCSTLWTAGTIRAGAGAGSAGVTVNPPNSTVVSGSFFCQ